MSIESPNWRAASWILAIAMAITACAGSCGEHASAGANADAPVHLPPQVPAATSPRLEVWPAPGAGKGPAIVLLYGAAGPALFTEATSDHRRYPQSFAAAGYMVVMPYYAEAGGDPLVVATRAIDLVRADPRVDPSRIAVVGYSRGANLALRLSAADRRVAAVVEFYGWLDDGVSVAHMPPTLILHGAKDRDVRVEQAYALERSLKASHVDYEIHVYPEQEHGFGKAALNDSASRAIAFLDARLRADASR